MKPTVQAPDFYMIGNDYVQAPLSSFFDTSVLSEAEAKQKALAILGYKAEPDEVEDETKPGYDKWMTWSALTAQLIETPAYYQDGIYTKLANDLSGKDGAYEADYFKNPEGFNKRRVYEDANRELLNVGETYGKDGDNVDVTKDKEQPTYDSKQYGAADIVLPEQYVEGDEPKA